jgi:hypothetical protein
MLGAKRMFEKRSIKYIQSEVSPEMMLNSGSRAMEYIRMLLDYGYEIGTVGFDGPFMEFVAGDELAKLPKSREFNIFCRLKDLK